MNLDPDDRNGARNRLLLKLLGGLVVAGVVIGLVVGVLGTTVLRSMGLKEQPVTESSSQTTSDESGSDNQDEQDDPEDVEDSESTPTSGDNESGESDKDQEPKKPRSVLNAMPNPASAGEEITLSGSFRKLQGGTLQVQRREGGSWTDFPVTASVDGNGSFSTYIITSRTGTSPFRMLHEETGRTSPVVRITIG